VVQAYLDEHGLSGAGLVVVDAEDGVVHEEYWGEFDEERISLVASSSKMLAAGVLLRLDDEGVLDMDVPIVEQLDWEGDSTITPAQLVSNSSGLVGLLPNPVYAPYICQYIADEAVGGTLQECGQTILGSTEDDADVVPPDTEFRYGGGQWQVAGAVAEAASGKSWAELIDETYVQPCGVDSLAFNNHFAQMPGDSPFDYPVAFDADPSTLDATDNPNIEGGAYISAPDYATLLLMHLRGGRCGDEQVLSQAAIDTMHADRIGPAYAGQASAGDLADDSPGYGMGWWVDRATGIIRDPGAYGAVPWIDLGAGYGGYLVIEATSDEGVELADEIRPLIASALDGA
jgi:CubicO group peptidase (beta-lactamase class C family)